MTDKVRWGRAIWLGIALFVVGVAAALSPVAWHAYREYQATRISPLIASSPELQSILAVVLDQTELEDVPPPPPPPGSGEVSTPRERKPVILIEETIAICEGERANNSRCKSAEDDSMFLFPELNRRLPLKFRRELVAANRIAVGFACPSSTWVQCADEKAVSDIFDKGGRWDDFYRKFPKTSGVAHVSNAVLSRDGTNALIYVSFRCDGLCGFGYLVLLERRGSTWVIERKEQVWIS